MKYAEKVNLICIPFSGGSFYSYNRFQSYLDDFINLVPLELPGRGKRYKEPLLTNIHDMVNDIFNQVKRLLDKPYAVYGHSLGAILGYLMVKNIVKENMPVPLHLFFSGRQAPSIQNKERNIHLLPKKAFIDKLIEYGGMPDELLKEKELLDFFEPIIRADFKAYETYKYEPDEPLDILLTVIIGADENITVQEAMEWQGITKRKILLRTFPGGHFFIFHHLPDMARIFSESLRLFD